MLTYAIKPTCQRKSYESISEVSKILCSPVRFRNLNFHPVLCPYPVSHEIFGPEFLQFWSATNGPPVGMLKLIYLCSTAIKAIQDHYKKRSIN